MIFYAVLAGSEWRVADIRRISRGVRPEPQNATSKQIELIEEMWSADPNNRPDFGNILKKTEDDDFWDGNVYKTDFEKYKGIVDTGDVGDLLLSRPTWRNYLQQTTSVPAFMEAIGRLERGCGMIDKISQALGYLTGTSDDVNSYVFSAVKWSLMTHGYLVPNRIHLYLIGIKTENEGSDCGRLPVKIPSGKPPALEEVPSDPQYVREDYSLAGPSWPDANKQAIVMGSDRALTIPLSSFEKIGYIGQGSYSTVYTARDPRTGRTVAVKILKSNAASEQLEKAFEREVQVLSAVEHPTLLCLCGYVPLNSPNGDPPAILTHYMAGHSLEYLIVSEGRGRAPAGWDNVQKVIVLYGVAVAMLILHRHHIIHRDLKPENVLLDEDLEPRVADFGMSKIVDVGATLDQMADVGTPLYMAPEVHEGEHYGWPVDVFSYWMLVYTTLSGRTPYEGVRFTSSLALAGKVVEGLRPEIPVDLDPKWKDLIIKCWQGNPNSRPDFERICRRFGNMDLVNGLDRSGLDRFLKYRRSVSPDDLGFASELANE
jgi:hypothetical protein